MQDQTLSEILAFISLFICGQGIGVLLILLSPRTKKSRSIYWLAAFIAVNCYSFLTEYFRYRGLAMPVFFYWPGFVYILEGALFYFYVRSLVNPGFRVESKHWVHLLPALFVILPTLGYTGGQQGPTIGYVGYLLYYTLLMAYGFAALRLLPDYDRLIRSNFSAISTIELDWLYKLIFVYILSSAVFLILRMLEFHSLINDPRFHQVYVPNTLIYGICFYFISVGGYFHQVIEDEALVECEDDGAQARAALRPEPDGRDAILLRELIDYMNSHEPFLDDSLSLRQLSAGVGLSPHKLSQLLNEQAGKNFYDFINGFRAERARNILQDAALSNLAMVDVGVEAGFANKATFYKHFKKQFCKTPREYRQQQIAASREPENSFNYSVKKSQPGTK